MSGRRLGRANNALEPPGDGEGFTRSKPMRIPLRLLIAFSFLTLAALPVPAGATQFRALLADTSRDTDPALSPDGKWLAFQSNRRGPTQIWVMPAQGGAPHPVTSEPESSQAEGAKRIGTRVMTPTWAPDSKSLLYVSTREGNYNIYSIPLDGGAAKPLSKAPGSQRFPAYSPDGTTICFPSSRLQPNALYGFQLYLMGAKGEIEGPPARQLTHSGGSPGHPVWSPDGKWITFVAKDFDTTRTVNIGGGMQTKQTALFAAFRVYKIPAAGGRETKLTGTRLDPGQGEDTWPSWSPDGKWIAYGRNVAGKQDVWILNVETRRPFQLTATGNCMKPTWSADGKSLYFTRLNGRDEDLWIATDLDYPAPGRKAAAPKPASKHGSSSRASSPKRSR
jgi:Tol biopolymer transport system component